MTKQDEHILPIKIEDMGYYRFAEAQRDADELILKRDYISKEFIKQNQNWTGKAILKLWEEKYG